MATAEKTKIQEALTKRLKTAEKFFHVGSRPEFNIKALCEALTMSRKEFEEYAGAPVGQSWNGEFKSFYKEGLEEKVSKLVQLAVLIDELFANKQSGKIWLRLPNPGFKNQSPLKTAISGKIEQAIDALENLSSGNVVA